jgi:Icc-related predicted phosphoesterase
MNRRKFVASFGLLGAVSAINPLTTLSKTIKSTQDPSVIMKCKPYLQAVQSNRVTVRWITHLPSHSWVEYGENHDNLNHKAQETEEGLIMVENRIHGVTLSNLLPGKRYFYRVVSRKTESVERKHQSFGEPVYSEIYSFTTLSKNIENVGFIVFNDVHDRPESFATLMNFQSPGKTDFVVLNGDTLSKIDNEDQIVNHLINPLTDLFATTAPFMFGRGNHETWGANSRNLRNYFDGRENKFYYSFEYGPLFGIVMDSGETKADNDPVNGGIVDFDDYREEQGKWLAKEVQKEAFKKAKYKIVFIHIPPYYLSDEAHASSQYNKLWGPIFNTSKIDLMICGHTHRHGIHQPVADQHNYPIVIGGGPADGKRTMIDVKVSRHSLNLRMTDDSGRIIGTLKL